MSESARSRSKAKDLRKYDFYGVPIYLRFWCNSDNEIKKLIVSWRRPASKTKSKKPYGEIVLERKYNLCESAPVYAHNGNLEEIIEKTLDYVMPKYFLPALFKNSDAKKAVLAGDLRLAAIFPYAWTLDQNEKDYSPDGTLPAKEAAYNKIMEKFRDIPIKELTPKYVAPWLLNDVPIGTAKNSVTMFRMLFNGVLANTQPSIQSEWERYHLSIFQNTYSPAIQVRNRLYLSILDSHETGKIMSRCEERIQGSKNAAKYFVAATMLSTGITLDEACALSLDCFVPLTEYPGKYGLCITRKLELTGTPRKKGDGHVRENRYVIKDIEDLCSRRILPVGSWMCSLLNQMERKSIDPKELLLHHPDNKSRPMHPKDFAAWLDTAFDGIINRKTIVIEKEVEDRRCVADYFVDTANHMLKTYGCLTEELRYQNGLPPSNTDARYYADFKSESSLVKMGLMQDLWLANVQALTSETEERTENLYQTESRPQQVPSLRLKIACSPQVNTDSAIILRVAGKFGFKGTINVNPHAPFDN